MQSLFHNVPDLKACSFLKKRIQHRCFPVKLAKFLWISILKNICERLLLKISKLQKKLFIDFIHKIMTFIIITITFEALKFLLSFCAVFANLFYKNIHSSLLSKLHSSKLNWLPRWNFFPKYSSHVNLEHFMLVV